MSFFLQIQNRNQALLIDDLKPGMFQFEPFIVPISCSAQLAPWEQRPAADWRKQPILFFYASFRDPCFW